MLELDEFYSKDEKVPKIDLEAFAKDHNKEKEGIKFEQDMAQLTKELENLDEGKYNNTSDITPTATCFCICYCALSTCQSLRQPAKLANLLAKTKIFLSR